MCDCEVCKYGRLVEENLANLPETQKAFFEDMYERLCFKEDSCARYKSILDGSWPYAKGILTNALSRCEGGDND